MIRKQERRFGMKRDFKPIIPTSHIIIFVVEIIAKIGVLVAIYVSNKKRLIVQNDEEDDDFE